MSESKMNIDHTARDIEQYFSGKLSPSQMHAIEKAALDDPFLTEAMEGYQGMEGKEWHSHLTALHQQLASPNTMDKVIPLRQVGYRWWKAVAAILIIGSGVTLTYVLTKDKDNSAGKQEIAQTITTVTDSTTPGLLPTSPATVNASVDNQENKSAKLFADKIAKANSGPVPGNISDAKTDSAFVYQTDRPQPSSAIIPVSPVGKDEVEKNRKSVTISNPAVNNNISSEKLNNKAEETNLSNAGNADVNRKKVNQIVTAPGKTQQLNNSFAAQIVGADNTPLPFSNISIKSENFGTYADVNGNFRLVSSDSSLTVEIRSVGYLPKTYMLRSNQSQNKIVLIEDEIAVKEKSIVKDRKTGDKLISRRATLIKDGAVNVEPAVGWDNYNTYISNNIELPDEVLKNNAHGEIGISFDVKSNGTISNVKIDPSLCNNCEEQAKRLIEQGPQWKIKKGKKASARVTVQY